MTESSRDQNPLSLEELADTTEVDPGYIRRLIELGAVPRDDGKSPYGTRDVHTVRLLRTWEEAGLAPEAVLSAVEQGKLSLSFLDTPAWTFAERLDRTYDELAAEQGVPQPILSGLHQALGFAPPQPDDRARDDDLVMVQTLRMLLEAGAPESDVLRLFRVFADNLRRIIQAQQDLYRNEIEQGLRRSGMNEGELMKWGSRFGREINALFEETMLVIYRRHRRHVWTEHSIGLAETALSEAGLLERITRPPAICFVDLTGYTQLTEEQGDRVAARLAVALSTLVEDISRRHNGTPIRWLGDGGMFHFKESGAAVLSALEMVESAPRSGLPPTHIGIHAGPVIFQDGDVYGRTVNIAARIAAVAGGGQVLASEAAVEHARDTDVRFELHGPASLKGVAEPVTLYRALPPNGG